LSSDQINPQIKSKVNIFAIDSLTLINIILQANKQYPLLDNLQEAARTGQDQTLKLEEGLLFFKNLLLIPDIDDLRIQLIRESHTPLPSAYPSPGKIIKMLCE
jgi:hypothetical protein